MDVYCYLIRNKKRDLLKFPLLENCGEASAKTSSELTTRWMSFIYLFSFVQSIGSHSPPHTHLGSVSQHIYHFS